jgi:flagellar biosynthesis/type III secretory pathway protein FliH
VSLAFDRAALAARRIIKRKLEEEAQATAPAVEASAQRAPVRGADVTA